MQKIIAKLKMNIKNVFIKNLSVVFSETVIVKLLNFAIILILTRGLGVEGYGKYSFVFIVIMFIFAFFDFGMENTAVRFSSKKQEERDSIFGLFILSKIVILFLLTLFLIFGNEFLFSFFNKQELLKYTPFIIVGIIGESLFFINDTYLQSLQKFKLRAFLNITNIVVKLLAIVLLLYTNNFKLDYILLIFGVPFVISLFFINRYIYFIKAFFNKKISAIKEIFSYQKWMFSLAITNNILTRIDIFFISFYFSFKEIGLYNAAFQLSAIASFLPFVLGKVILPKISTYSKNKIYKFIFDTEKIISLLSLIIIAMLPVINQVIPFLLGEKYTQSIIIFNILVVGALLTLLTVPMEQGLYALGKPKIISVVKYFQVFIIILLNMLFLKSFGIVFAAISILASKAIYLAVIHIYILFVKSNDLKIESKQNERTIGSCSRDILNTCYEKGCYEE